MAVYEYRQIIAPAIILLPITVAITRYTKLPVYAKCLLYYLVCSGLLNTVATILSLNRINNYWVLHLLTAVESIFLFYYFYRIIPGKIRKQLILALLFLFPLFSVVNSLFIQSLSDFNSYARPVEMILIIAMCALYWWQDNEPDADKDWGEIPNNWFVTGLMVYYSCTFFIFLLAKYIPSDDTNRKTWNLVMDSNASFWLIVFLLMTAGFMKCRK